jgi:6-phosphogluconolactonase
VGNPSNIVVLENTEAVARAVADRFVADAKNGIAKSGRFSVALAGGSTPKLTYQLLNTDQYRRQVSWSKTHVFFGDERMVPPDHPDSNYLTAQETLLAHAPIPANNVHPIRGVGEPSESAQLYERELKTFFQGQSWPRFDLVLLGIGEDGHTASLFPRADALNENFKWVVATWIEKLKTFRITLTAPAINHAVHIVFIVTGAKKAARLKQVLHGPPEPLLLPAQLIRPVEGLLEWVVDKAAASEL